MANMDSQAAIDNQKIIKEAGDWQSQYEPVGFSSTVKRKNEDAWWIFTGGWLKVFAVADGVGGVVGGEKASNGVIHDLIEVARKCNDEERYVNQEDLREIHDRTDFGATTLVVAQQIDQNQYGILSVGDSSALVVDEKNGQVMDLIPKKDENSQGKLTQAIGLMAGDSGFKQATYAQVFLEPGQTLLLCSDGITKKVKKGVLKGRQIADWRKMNRDDNRAFVEGLVEMVREAGERDDVTVVSIPYNPQQNWHKY